MSERQVHAAVTDPAYDITVTVRGDDTARLWQLAGRILAGADDAWRAAKQEEAADAGR